MSAKGIGLEGTVPYHSSARKNSLPLPPSLPRFDIRRASAPAIELSTVGEMDEETLISSGADMKVGSTNSAKAVPCLQDSVPGSALLHPSKEWQGFGSDLSAHSNLDGAQTGTQEPSGRDSSSSLSTPSSRRSGYSANSGTDCPLGLRPVVAEVKPSDKVSPHQMEASQRWSRSSASDTLDFSTGRSIWC